MIAFSYFLCCAAFVNRALEIPKRNDIAMAEAVAHRQREDFTSEAFKIEVRNIANYGFGVRQRSDRCFEVIYS